MHKALLMELAVYRLAGIPWSKAQRASLRTVRCTKKCDCAESVKKMVRK